MALILASTSRHRRQLLERLGLDFIAVPPGVDEAAHAGESPAELATRLARTKAETVAANHPASLIIGSDQVAALDGKPLGKPGTESRALAQLQACSGRRVRFHTGLCLLDTRQGKAFEHLDTTEVHFRPLSLEEIQRYLHAEQPYDCAGSFKSEGLGIALFESIESRDPSALIGLPLIALTRFLRACGLNLP